MRWRSAASRAVLVGMPVWMMVMVLLGSLPSENRDGSGRSRKPRAEESALEGGGQGWRGLCARIEQAFRNEATVNPELLRRLATGRVLLVPFLGGDETIFEVDREYVASLSRYHDTTDLVGYFVYLSEEGDVLTLTRVYPGLETEEVLIRVSGSGERTQRLERIPSLEDRVQWFRQDGHLLVILQVGPRQEREAGRLIVKTVTAL